MEPTEGSETSVALKMTPGIYPKEDIQHSRPDESLKSSNRFVVRTQAIHNLSYLTVLFVRAVTRADSVCLLPDGFFFVNEDT
jgi:hypothetical protein